MNVSIRDLKNGLSAYLRLVRRGERIVVTDRGEPVAELAPAREEKLSLEQRMERLAASGELRRPRGRRRLGAVVPTRVRGGPLSATVLAERG
jgi:prevent-host-death family protein